jgi:UDP-N-acetylglucosamine:LPS N-acetylglucosamine transferase
LLDSRPFAPVATADVRIAIVSASIGSGHDGVAGELARRLRACGFVVDCHDFVALWPAGRLLKAGYARQLRVAPRTWGWLLAVLARCRPLSRLTATWVTAGAASRLRRALGEDLMVVVSTYPLASQTLGRLRRRGALTVPVVTFLTDMSVHPLWVAPMVGTHLALHPVAAAQAEALGAHGVRVTGPAVAPLFRPGSAADQRAARARFGLPERAPLALVVAGAWGVGEIATTATEIAATGVAIPVVACGHNEDLRAHLAAEGIAVVGWTDAMAELICACDVVVQNAGGLSCLEALACGLPVLSYRCLPGHGRTNAAALEQAGWIRWIREPSELATALKTALTEHSERPPAAGVDPVAEVIAVSFRRHR